MLLLPSFFLVFLANVSQCIFFGFCHISVCCCYHCGEKRLVNSIPLFYCNDNHDGDFWRWAVINIVIILGMWGRLPIPCGYGYCHHLDCTAGKWGRGAGSIPPPPTVVVGGMTPNAVAATARSHCKEGSWSQLWKVLIHSSKFVHHISVWQL